MNKVKLKYTFKIIFSLLWFIGISFLLARTEYANNLANILTADGNDTTAQSVIAVLISIASFMPSGLVLLAPYIKKEFSDYTLLRIIVASFIVSFALFIPYSLFNFYINF